MKETVDSSDLSHPQQAWRGGLKEGGWGPADVIELIISNKDAEMSVSQPVCSKWVSKFTRPAPSYLF